MPNFTACQRLKKLIKCFELSEFSREFIFEMSKDKQKIHFLLHDDESFRHNSEFWH